MAETPLQKGKAIYGLAKLKLRARGIFIKKLPMTLLRRYDERSNNDPVDLRSTFQLLDQLDLVNTVTGWGRGHLEGPYLQELLVGSPWVKNGTFVIAYKVEDDELIPVGFLVYGGFTNKRKVSNNAPYYIAINGVSSQQLAQTAEVEAIVTNPDVEGIGGDLFAYAVGDKEA